MRCRLFVLAAAVTVCAAAAGAAAAPPLAHDLTVRLQPATGEIMVTDSITVDGRERLHLDLAPWLEIDAVTIDGQPQPVVTPLVLSFADAGPHRVRLVYGGQAPDPGGGRTTAASRISAAGVFLPAFGGWLPRSGGEPVTHKLAVEVPPGFRAVATGRLTSEADAAAGYRATYVEDRPGEGPSLFAGPWTVAERHVGGVRFRTWFDADNTFLADLYLDRASALVAHYSSEIGDYPHADLHIVAAPMPVGLGFPGVLYVSHRILPLPFMQGRSLAHEVLHVWWGNGVAVDPGGGNWAEGLTTYMADHWLAEQQGADDARSLRLGWLRDYRALPAERDIPLAAFTGKRHDADQVVGYGKAAFVFHMLRAEIGEEAFAAGLRSFWRDHRFGVAGWSDLQRAFEAAAGRDLGWFFDQWLRRAGAPSLRLDGVDVAATDAGDGHAVTVLLGQGTEPSYQLSIPLTVTTAAGRMAATVPLVGPAAAATLAVSAVPIEVAVDPGYDLFRRLTLAETPPVLRDVTLDPGAAVVLAVPPDADAPARALAARLMDGPPRFAGAAAAADGTLLVIGTGEALAAALTALGLDGAPDDLAGRGTARVWSGRRGGDHPYVIVAADDAAALRAIADPLPHYGRSGYLIFEGRRALARGLRPAAERPLTRTLDPAR